MNKPTKKRESYNSDVIETLIKKYGVSRRYITMSLKGDRVGLLPDRIIKDYKIFKQTIDNALDEKLKA